MISLYSWNVNGIRAVIRKELFKPFIEEHQPDILCLQETKVNPSWLSERRDFKSAGNGKPLLRQGVAVATPRSKKLASSGDLESQAGKPGRVSLTAKQGQAEIDMPDYQEFWYSAEKPGYSGTAIFSKFSPMQIINGFPKDIIDKFHVTGDIFGDPNKEGRVIAAEYEDFWVVTVYTPNAKDDLSRIPLRHKQWDPAFLAYCQQLEATGKPVIFNGDFNVAHTEDDLANPKPNRGKKGFTEEERAGFQAFIDAGFVDTFRMFHQGNGYYTWWSHFAQARARNVGWRIDYMLVSASLRDKVVAADIHPEVTGSDHCPVSITLDI